MAWKDPFENKTYTGAWGWIPETGRWVGNTVGKGVYDITGYDPFGGSSYDYYGKDIQRDIANKLGTAREAQYDAAVKKLAEQFGIARTRTNQSAQARGLAKSGFAAEQERQLTGQQGMAEEDVYANLLGQEQQFLDTMYMQNKETALKVALNERAESLARQIAFQDFIAESIGSLGSLASAATTIAAA